ncbi:amino acid ABC transporter ATP-binding/permease protein [Butyrivibrio sp. INlla14]|uniref:amino acid ABC transporter ATP-binding/permease protein n=1 Tax=Butyrivibrio sp. INlla14 TaxID=1520808 RepID=UPI0008763692|nr:ABC transporter ATP-binding protein [Butyrivibrio sp. INlla14]SCY55980.1 ATP-binding cassette, subfamily C [Butyrivibrio sp. INlla14]
MKKQNKALILLRMLKLVKPLSGFMILAVVLGTLGFFTAEFIPILGGEAILIGLGIQTKLSWNMLVWLLLSFAILRAIFRFTEQRTNHYIAFTLLAIIRDKVFKALRRLCPAKLEGRDKGDLISLITSDVELLEVFYAHTISPICIAIVSETIMCLFIGSFHPLLGIAALIAFTLVGVILPIIISKRSGTTGDELRAQSGELSAHMLESIRGIDDILQYSFGEKRLKEISDKTRALSERQGVLSKLTGTNMAIANMLILISDIAMLLVCAWLYQAGQIGFDGFLIPMIALMSSFGPVTALASLGTTLQSTVASGARVLAIIDEEPETEDITGKASAIFDGAEVKNVSFAYAGENVLNNISLQVPKGKIVGIVGKSGCGKSTLLKLLMRFWNACNGEISVSGRNVSEINTADLRDMESYMTQETELFKDTISNNIRIGKLDATDEEVVKACKKASIHDFIMTLPKGYETEVGELGSTLSGGERQRIGLARAFLHNAPFMLLDEPTSNLDSLNEAVILKSLKEEGREKTVLLVSHRESTMRIAEKTLAMEGGRIS